MIKKFGLILLVMMIVFINFASASNVYVFQEQANISTGYGGTLNTGSYSCGTNWDNNDCGKGIDGDYGTYARREGFPPASNVTMYYQKPLRTLNTTKWIVKYDDTEIANLDLPYICWNASSTNLTLFVISDYSSAWLLYTYCWNSTSFQLISSYSGAYKYLWEEGINWSYDSFAENSITYNSTTYETAQESFDINLTYNSLQWSGISAELYYDGTAYSGTKTGSNDNLKFSRTIGIPTVSADTNKSFYWSIAMSNSSGVYYFNSSLSNQTVRNILIDDCSSYTVKFMNLTLRDEETKQLINGATYNTTIETFINISTPDKNYSFTYNNNFSEDNEVVLCFNNNLTGSNTILDAEIRYDGDGYANEFYYLQNETLNNATIPYNISLYDLKDDDSTEFIITAKDENYLPVENALIIIKRKYVEDGIYRIVEMSKTDYYGQGKLHLDTNNIIYGTLVMKDGEVISSYDNVVVFCNDVLTGDCKINLEARISTPSIPDYYSYQGINYGFVFNESTRTASLGFTSEDLSNVLVSLNLTNYDGYGNDTICSTQLITSSGTLTCTIPASYGNLTFYADVYVNGDLVFSKLLQIREKATSIFGDNTVILVIGLFLTLPLMLLPSAIGVLIGGIIGLIMGIIMFSISKGIFATTSFIIWVIVAATIIIWMANKRRLG